MQKNKFIKLENKASHWHLELARPEVRNAFNDEMVLEITQFFKGLKKHKVNSRSPRFVHLLGQGPSFSAGADLEWMKKSMTWTPAKNKKSAENIFYMFFSMLECPLPIVTTVHGHVMAGGLGLVAASDIVLADEKTQFAFTEVRLGLAPAVISYFVRQKVNLSACIEYMLTGQIFTAEQSHKMGLVQYCGSREKIEADFLNLKNNFLRVGPRAVTETKKLLFSHNKAHLKKALKETTACIARLRTSPEGQEGMKSFLEKRTPQWAFSSPLKNENKIL